MTIETNSFWSRFDNQRLSLEEELLRRNYVYLDVLKATTLKVISNPRMSEVSEKHPDPSRLNVGFRF
jgi:hypothetical protein